MSAGDDSERPFPAESEWLGLSPPPEATGLPTPDFVARTLAAITEERALDRDLDALDRDLPRIVLAAHTPPPTRPDFVAATLAKVRDDRRARWQQLLARHIAPEPSAGFVHRTLAALAHDREERVAETTTWAARASRHWPLLAAAAALLVLLLWRTGPEPSLQLQLARSASTMAHAWTSPVAVLLVADDERRDPQALPAGAPDGIQLAFAKESR